MGTKAPATSPEAQLRAENAELRARLEEAEDTLRAIRSGEVEALVVETADGPQIFTLQGLDAESNRFRGEILAQVSDFVIAVDADQRVTYLNVAAERQYRIPASDALGRQLSEIFTRRWPCAEAETAMWAALREYGEWRGELIHRTYDGRELQVEAWLTRLRDADGADAGMVTAIRDITERKRSAAELQRVSELLDTLLRTAPIGFCFLDRDLRFVRINERLAEMNGISVEAHLGRQVSEILPTLVDTLRDVTGRILKTGEAELNHEFSGETSAAPGVTRFWNESWYPVRDGAGEVVGFGGIIEEITERKKAEHTHASLEAQLRESQKMEAIGTLAGGIAHDFNNILGAILGNVELARQDAAANWQALVSLDEIQKAGYRARDLVQQILSFSRRQTTARRVMALAPVVEESVRLLRATLYGGMQIDCRYAADTPAVVADPTQVQQVLLNLGTNAAHAMQGRPGSIDIQVECIALDEIAAQHDLNLRPGRYARIVVRDAGHGMDSATLRRIFEPFFTTKPVGEGTGLGLPVAHGIMQAHDGAIIAHSEPGTGSRFELYFPRADEAPVTGHAVTDAAAAGEGRGRHILYIDDDEAQVYMIKRMLERWGYRVSTYIEQREALVALRAGNIQFDLVVTDFHMPGMSGVEVARAIRDAQPDLPVIVVSGYITDALRTQAAAAGVRELIAKTQVVEELRDALQRLALKPSHG